MARCTMRVIEARRRMRAARRAGSYLLPLLLLGCGGDKNKVQVQVPAEIQAPVSVSDDEPQADTELVVKGRFQADKDAKVGRVLISIKRKTSDGKIVVANSTFADSKREGSGLYAYDGTIKTPPTAGDYVVEAAVGRQVLGAHPIKVVSPTAAK